jgi:hypothetical protein
MTDRLLAGLAMLGPLGLVGLVINFVFSFEEPNAALLLVSAIGCLAAPVGVLLHLRFTAALTHEEKRIWLHEFTSRRAPSAFSEYLSSADRQVSARRRAEESLVRRRTN